VALDAKITAVVIDAATGEPDTLDPYVALVTFASVTKWWTRPPNDAGHGTRSKYPGCDGANSSPIRYRARRRRDCAFHIANTSGE
jgi:hypothetical protein